MTTSAPVYTSAVGAQALAVRGGEFDFDVARAPHVQGTLQIGSLSQAQRALLDPRNRPRVVTTVTRGAVTRVFDLHVRDRADARENADLSLTLASDEALLGDWAPLADDDAPFALASSLRSVCNYVIGKVIPGATLQASPALDANVTPYWRVTNLAKNPGPRSGTTTGYIAGSGTSSITASNVYERPCVGFFAASTGGAFLNCPATGVRITPGRKYTAIGEVISGTTARAVRMMIRFKDQAGNILRDVYGATVMSKTNGWPTVTATVDERPYVTAEAPVNATAVEVYVNVPTNTSGQFHGAGRVMCYEGDRRIPYHDGATAPAGYTTAWDDAANPDTSASTRTPVTERALDSVIWRAGVTALAFLLPLAQAQGYRLVCDETRKWTLRAANYTADGVINVATGANAITATDTISRDSDEWYDARVTRYRWTDQYGIQQERVDAFALTTPYSRVTTVTIDAPYPGPGRSEYAVRRAQGRGRSVEVSRMAEWTERCEQPTALRLDAAPVQTGKAQRIRFDLDTDVCTISDRTTDTNEHAWILQTPAAWTTGPVGEAWTEAT